MGRCRWGRSGWGQFLKKTLNNDNIMTNDPKQSIYIIIFNLSLGSETMPGTRGQKPIPQVKIQVQRTCKCCDKRSVGASEARSSMSLLSFLRSSHLSGKPAIQTDDIRHPDCWLFALGCIQPISQPPPPLPWMVSSSYCIRSKWFVREEVGYRDAPHLIFKPGGPTRPTDAQFLY